MIKSRVVGFNEAEIKEQLLRSIVAKQSKLLADYADDLTQKIGNTINGYASKNHMDRTGNLLDSLCWGVSYEGKLVYSGFFRERKASHDSYMHEWLSGDDKTLYPVNGRMFAEEYLQRYGNSGSGEGWRVFVAILAPYWGFWENGFMMKSGGGFSGIPFSQRWRQFAVMTQYYDTVKKDLKPARVRFRHPVSKYSAAGVNRRRDRDFEGKVTNPYNWGRKNLK